MTDIANMIMEEWQTSAVNGRRFRIVFFGPTARTAAFWVVDEFVESDKGPNFIFSGFPLISREYAERALQEALAGEGRDLTGFMQTVMKEDS